MQKTTPFINHQPSQRAGADPDPVWIGSKWMLVFLKVSFTPGTPPHTIYFSPRFSLNVSRRTARSLFEIGRLFSLFSCLFLTCLLIFLLLLMNGNVLPNLGLIFPCSVCAGNVTWRGKSVPCCTCFKWVQLRCSPLFYSRFKTLSSSLQCNFCPTIFKV